MNSSNYTTLKPNCLALVRRHSLTLHTNAPIIGIKHWLQRCAKEERFTIKTCVNCRYLLYDDMVFCARCGSSQTKTVVATYSPPVKQKHLSRPFAILLAFALGVFGAHHFYLRHYIKGALSLCFCWTFIPLLISLLEGIVMLCQTNSQFLSIHSR